MSLLLLHHSTGKKHRKETYIPKDNIIFQTRQISDKELFLMVSCKFCTYFLKQSVFINQCILHTLGTQQSLLLEMENHVGSFHGELITKELLIKYFTEKGQIKGRNTILQRIIDDLELNYFIYHDKRFSNYYRYNTDLAKLVNEMIRNREIIQIKIGRTYCFTLNRIKI